MRFLWMKRECIICGKTAHCYRLERDGVRTYLCEQHMLVYEHPEFEPLALKTASPQPRQGK